MKKRQANFELLRIIAMLMIITLHYLDKGGILPKPDSAFGMVGYMAWGIEALCVPAVNVYVLISAYFLAESDYHPMKAVKLWLQVMFYSVGIAVLLTVTGVIPVAEWDIYRGFGILFPVISEHYWFVTAYILMYLLAPLFRDTLKKLPEKTFRQGIFLLLLLLSVSKSLLPVTLPTDRLGYDVIWFLCLHLIGSYIRYHLPIEQLKGTGAAVGYFVSCGIIFVSLVVVNGIYIKMGSLGQFINRQYHYNGIFCLLASVCLFLAFAKLQINGEKLSGWICKAASASFGVYLIHEHVELRYQWPVWLGVRNFADTPLFLIHLAGSVLLLYLVCMIIDFCRQCLFGLIKGR